MAWAWQRLNWLAGPVQANLPGDGVKLTLEAGKGRETLDPPIESANSFRPQKSQARDAIERRADDDATWDLFK